MKSELRVIVEILSRHFEISEAILYGSEARGEGHPGSDVDIMVFVPPQVIYSWRYRNPANLFEKLRQELGHNGFKLGSGPGQIHLIATTHQEAERQGADRYFWEDVKLQGKRFRFRT